MNVLLIIYFICLPKFTGLNGIISWMIYDKHLLPSHVGFCLYKRVDVERKGKHKKKLYLAAMNKEWEINFFLFLRVETKLKSSSFWYRPISLRHERCCKAKVKSWNRESSIFTRLSNFFKEVFFLFPSLKHSNNFRE